MAKIKAVHSSSAPEHPLNPVNNFFNSALDKAKDDNINVLALENKPELNKLEGANGQNDSLWGTLVTDGPKREELTKPLNNSETLQNHWRQWGLDNTGGFSTDLHEADSLSSAAKDVMDYAKAHPELVRAWDTNGDGKVTYDELKSFVVNTKSDIKSVAQAYKKYRENNPHANRTSDQMVRDAALVAANIHLIGGGVSDHLIEGQKGNEGEYVNKWQLYYFAQSNSQFSQDLKNAANLVSHEGMSRIFDAHGDNPATAKSDYLFDAENITKWIASDAAPDTSVDFMTLMENVANADIIADVDLSEIGPEVFKGDLDAKTTAAVLAKLVDMRLKLKAGDASNLWDPYGKDGLNGNINTVKRDLDKKIEILSNDQETLEYLRANAPKSLQSLINADPQLKAQLQHHYDYELSQGYYDYDYSNSGAFNDIFYRRDENGKILSTPDAVREFVADANEIRQALGLPLGSLKDIAMKSGHYDDVVAYYETHLKDAQDLQGYLNEGMDANEAAKVYYRDLNAFSRVLGMSDGELSVAGGKAQDLLIDKKASETTTTAFYNQFEDGNGNLDEGKLGTFLEGLKDTNPEMFTDALGEQISPDTIIRGIRAVWDTIRHGETTLLALEDLKASLGKDSIDRGEHITVMHKQGIMHAGTALLLGTAVGVAAAGKPETAPELLSVIGGGVSTVSFSLIAGGKYSKFSHTEIARNIEDKAKYNTEIEKKIDGENKKLKTLEEHKVDREEIIAANQRRLEKGKFKKDDYYEFFLERQIENEKSEIKKLDKELKNTENKVRELNKEKESKLPEINAENNLHENSNSRSFDDAIANEQRKALTAGKISSYGNIGQAAGGIVSGAGLLMAGNDYRANGDDALAGLSFAQGGMSIAVATADIADTSLALAKAGGARLPAFASAAASTVAGGVSFLGAIFSGVAGLVTGGIEAHRYFKNQEEFYDTLAPSMKQFGIGQGPTTGPIHPGPYDVDFDSNPV